MRLVRVALGKYGDAAAGVPDRAFPDRAIKAISVKDYAFTVTRWNGLELTASIRRLLDRPATAPRTSTGRKPTPPGFI